MKKLLVVEAHSDDSAISISGFLEKVKDDYEIHFLLLVCSDINLHHSGLVARQTRLDEYQKYVSHFNGKWHFNNRTPFDADSILDTIPKKEVISEIENVIALVKPDVMICQGPSFHQDHIVVYESAIAATRPTTLFCPREIYITENPTYVHSLGPHTDFKPDFYINLSRAEIERKLQFFKDCFPSQIRQKGNYLSENGIKAWAKYRGIEARCEYAEALKTYIRVI